MNTSRRNFIKTGTLAAVFAGTNLFTVGFCSAQEKSAASGELPEKVFGDPLLHLTAANFREYVGTEFSVLTDVGGAVAVLSNVTETQQSVEPVRRFGDAFRRRTRAENFVLSFRVSASDFSQATYRLRHPNLGQFDLFLVPGSSENNENLLHAVINRI
jgi:hypothetical protein